MIKLNKSQTSALASKVIEEITRPITEYNNAVRESKEYENFINTNTQCKQLDKIVEKYGESHKYTCERLKTNIRNSHFKDKFKKVPRLSELNVENEIILETIECNNLNELINNIKIKFQ